jgi:hypothetical protein
MLIYNTIHPLRIFFYKLSGYSSEGGGSVVAAISGTQGKLKKQQKMTRTKTLLNKPQVRRKSYEEKNCGHKINKT